MMSGVGILRTHPVHNMHRLLSRAHRGPHDEPRALDGIHLEVSLCGECWCLAMAHAIIFDLDGTLADSSECVVQSAQKSPEPLAFELSAMRTYGSA